MVSNEFSAEELICACDLWIATASSTAVEAVILGRPVALLNCDGGNFMPELVHAGVAVYVRHPGELQALMRGIVTAGSGDGSLAAGREAFLRDRLYKLDGRATERVAALIQDMMRPITRL